jgi:hypothetical protein
MICLSLVFRLLLHSYFVIFIIFASVRSRQSMTFPLTSLFSISCLLMLNLNICAIRSLLSAVWRTTNNYEGLEPPKQQVQDLPLQPTWIVLGVCWAWDIASSQLVPMSVTHEPTASVHQRESRAWISCHHRSFETDATHLSTETWWLHSHLE